MGCAISPILFVIVFEVVLRGARQVVEGIKLPTGKRLPRYMDAVNASCDWLHVQPDSSNVLMSLLLGQGYQSIRKYILQAKNSFVTGGEPIPRLEEKTLQGQSRQYTADLSDR